eukprot:4594641-Prymnesium_polylepis.1
MRARATPTRSPPARRRVGASACVRARNAVHWGHLPPGAHGLLQTSDPVAKHRPLPRVAAAAPFGVG